MNGNGTVWIVVRLDDEDKLEISGVFDSFDAAMDIVRDDPRSGCAELELGRDYRDVKNFKMHTADHPEGIDT